MFLRLLTLENGVVAVWPLLSMQGLSHWKAWHRFYWTFIFLDYFFISVEILLLRLSGSFVLNCSDCLMSNYLEVFSQDLKINTMLNQWCRRFNDSLLSTNSDHTTILVLLDLTLTIGKRKVNLKEEFVRSAVAVKWLSDSGAEGEVLFEPW